MSTSTPDQPRATHVQVTADALEVTLEDGRQLSVPLEWFPRLRQATKAERKNLRLLGGGVGIHWPQIDEDLSVAGLLMPPARVVTANSAPEVRVSATHHRRAR